MASSGNKISRDEAIIMIIIAVIFDVLSFIPIVNIISGIISYVLFFMWFQLRGVSFSTNRHIARNSVIGVIIAVIPVIAMLPENTAIVIMNIYGINKNAKVEKASGGSALQQLQNKKNKTKEDIFRLNRAREIQRKQYIYSREMNDPVYKEAWSKATKGKKTVDNSGIMYAENGSYAKEVKKGNTVIDNPTPAPLVQKPHPGVTRKDTVSKDAIPHEELNSLAARGRARTQAHLRAKEEQFQTAARDSTEYRGPTEGLGKSEEDRAKWASRKRYDKQVYDAERATKAREFMEEFYNHK